MSFVIECKNGTKVDVWYNRSIRLWTIQHKDKDGNQIGDAEYESTRPRAYTAAKFIEAQEEDPAFKALVNSHMERFGVLT